MMEEGVSPLLECLGIGDRGVICGTSPAPCAASDGGNATFV